jgi:hypothetical protein
MLLARYGAYTLGSWVGAVSVSYTAVTTMIPEIASCADGMQKSVVLPSSP